MRRTGMRGGADEDKYKISEVLGPKFQHFVSTLKPENGGLKNYTFEAMGDVRPGSKYKPNDIHYNFTEYLMAIAAAFRYIENPDVEKAQASAGFAGDIEKVFDQLASGDVGGLHKIPENELYFAELPYDISDNIKYIGKGFHYFPYIEEVYPNVDKKPVNSLVNAIRFIYYFISNLDLQKSSLAGINQALQQSATYRRYVKDIVDVLADPVKYTSEDIKIGKDEDEDEKKRAVIENSVYDGLKAVAAKIKNTLASVKSYKNIPIEFGTNDTKDFVKIFDVFEGKSEALAEKFEKCWNAIEKLREDPKWDSYKIHLLNPVNPIPKEEFGEEGEKGDAWGGGNGDDESDGDDEGMGVVEEEDDEKELEDLNGLEDVVRALGIFIDSLAKAGDINTNPYKVAATSAISSLILDQKVDKVLIEDSLREYPLILARLRSIPSVKKIKEQIKDMKDLFVSQFVKKAYKSLNVGSESWASSSSKKKSNTLANDTIWNFYNDIVKKNPSFYNKYFNLIRLEDISKDEPRNDDVGIIDIDKANRGKYRLNVRKATGFTQLKLLQQGGATNFGDIVFTLDIPEYPTDESLGSIWISPSEEITKEQIAESMTENAFKKIFMTLYVSPEDQETFNLGGKDYQINLQKVTNEAAKPGFLRIGIQQLFDNYLKHIQTKGSTIPTDLWKDNEKLISKHVLMEGNKWTRDPQNNIFVKLDKNGNPEETKVIDNCKFINDNIQDCVEFLTQCIMPGTDDADSYNNFCKKFLSFDFNSLISNPGTEVLKERVQSLNPAVAFAILHKLKFGSYLAEEASHPVKGFRRYKVQSVGSWLNELINGKNKQRDCCVDPKKNIAPAYGKNFNCGPLYDQLGELADVIIGMAKDSNKRNFFNYLDILVDWVNVNHQVLNVEELPSPDRKGRGRYPKRDKSFDLFDHLNPYRPGVLRVRNYLCELDRLKGGIQTGSLFGFDASTTISNIAGIPQGFEMPFNRLGFANTLPQGNIFPVMAGGSAVYETEAEFRNIDQAYGYATLKSIYDDLRHTMESMMGEKRMKLSQNTMNHIQEKLVKFKEIEEELRKSLQRLVEKNRLYQASNGHINPYVDDSQKFAAILDKHSNLLHLNTSYNKKATNIIDLFRAISTAILGKFDATANSQGPTQSQGNVYERPMTMGYHYPAHSNGQGMAQTPGERWHQNSTNGQEWYNRPMAMSASFQFGGAKKNQRRH